MKIPFIGPTSEERSRDADYQRTVNWYVEKSASGDIVLYPTPGANFFTTVGQGPHRGSIVFDDLLWVVSGDKLFSVDTAGTPTERGTLATSGGRVEMAHNGAENGKQLILVDGVNGYIWDDTYSTFFVIEQKATGTTTQDVTNGTFDADSDWTKGTGWTIGSGTASCDGTQMADTDLSQTIDPRDTEDYTVTFTVSNYSAGDITPVLGGTLGTARSADGTFTETITSGSGTDIDFRGDADFTGDIDDVVVFENSTITDSSANFSTSDVKAGMVVFNTTDSTSSRVSEVVPGTSQGTSPKVVIEDDIFDNGESYEIGDDDFPNGATHVRFMDSFFLVNDPTTSGRFRRSDSYDGTTWGANNFATAERDPDALVALEVSGRELWLLGENTTEVWFNAGTAGAMPFEPMQNAFIEWGCIAPYTVSESDAGIFWLGQNEEGKGIVLHAQSIQPRIISTWAIANEIDTFSTISDAFGFIYQFKQHVFYVLQFPTESRTLVYDIVTGMWHEWETNGAGHLSNTHDFFDGSHVVGDKSNNNLYKLDSETYQDNGMVIERIRRSPHLSVEDKPSFHHSLVVEFQTGVGNANDASPQVMLKWSDDGGYTWSNEYWRSLGAVGEYSTQVQWRKLGRSRDRVYEIKVTDAVNPVILSAYANIVPVERPTD